MLSAAYCAAASAGGDSVQRVIIHRTNKLQIRRKRKKKLLHLVRTTEAKDFNTSTNVFHSFRGGTVIVI